MLDLSKLYRPTTAQPFLNNEIHVEIMPCEALRPYVSCFWGEPGIYSGNRRTEKTDRLVIPDSCMDILFSLDKDNNIVSSIFTGININSFYAKNNSSNGNTSLFAIRFPFWAVPLFSDESMRSALDAFADTDEYFKNFRRDFEEIFKMHTAMPDRIIKVEQYLLGILNGDRLNSNVMNALHKLIAMKGTAKITDLMSYTAVSSRQLERLFKEYAGLSPKQISGLIRYQYLWQDVLSNSRFNIQDAVFRYGYSDQAHLLNDFKKYHSLTPSDAKILALHRS